MSVCNHINLDFFAQSDYFSAEFISIRETRGDIFPTICVDCNRKFTNVKSTGTV